MTVHINLRGRAGAEAALQRAVAGPVLFAGDPGIDAELAGYNTAVTHHPAAVIGATSAGDVATAVRYAAERGLAVGVHATGHGGVSSTDTVIVTTSRMQQFTVDPARRRAVVAAGVKWGSVIQAAAPYGLAPLNGSTSDVGVVGYTVGGGMGPMVRRYGNAADHVTALEIVTADGRIRHVDPTHDPDLFWAVRGGKANFGVVTRLSFELMPVGRLYGGALYYSGEHAHTVLQTWRYWSATLDENTTSSIALLRLPDLPQVPAPLRGTCTVHLRVAHLGDPARGAQLLVPMRAAAPPLIDAVRDMPYAEVDTIHNDPTDPMPGWDRGIFLRELPPVTVDTLLEVAGPQHPQLPLIMVEVRHLGGAANRQPEPPNAAGGRDAGYSAGVAGPFPPPLRDIVPVLGQGVLDAVAPWGTGEVPINFAADIRTPADVGRPWSPQTYQRLLEIKHRYDPANTFRTGNTLILTTGPELAETPDTPPHSLGRIQ
ncbi:MAG: FAD-binding oxidoreductase [Actinobacteria bacterium]|nr:FAD-binding oxidoreductase [Actinomycetota bacterium]